MNLIDLPHAARNRIWVLVIAAVVDLVIGDPHWMWHPVQGMGSLISILEKILRGLFRIPASDKAAKEEETDRSPTVTAVRDRSGRPAGRSFHSRERRAGLLLAIIVLTVSTGIAVLLLTLCGRVHSCLRIAVEGILCGRLLAQKSLAQAGIAVRDPLIRGDAEKARREVSMIVGRDTDRLTPEGIAKAAVETIAENTSDGVTAPLFYAILFGGTGCVFYKAVNTMDSMIGYRNDRYRYFGTAAARLDDVMNYIPSRLTALLMILSCVLPGKKETVNVKIPAPGMRLPEQAEVPVSGTVPLEYAEIPAPGMRVPEQAEMQAFLSRTVRIPDASAALRIWRRDNRKSPSPNSAQTESVCAGALHLRLLGDTWYFGELHHKAEIGDGGRSVEAEDITRAIRLMNRTTALLYMLGFLGLAAAVLAMT